VFAGDRSAEFEHRLQGVSYAEIAAAGGGILATVRATREASEEQLYELSANRLKDTLAEGVTGIEIKSGYGLDEDSELKMLRVARRLGEDFPVRVSTTFLGAHALPPEYANDRKAYIDWLCQRMIPRIAEEKLADAVDAFCEHIGFTPEETRRVFDAAVRHDLPVKLHADQLSDLNGAALVAEYCGLSTAGGCLSPASGAHGRGHRLQPGHRTDHVPAHQPQHGLCAFWPDAGRGPGRRHHPRGPGLGVGQKQRPGGQRDAGRSGHLERVRTGTTAVLARRQPPARAGLCRGLAGLKPGNIRSAAYGLTNQRQIRCPARVPVPPAAVRGQSRLHPPGIITCACRDFSSNIGTRPTKVVREVSKMARKRCLPALSTA